MAIFKCKMCGGTLEIGDKQSVAVCEYCATKQTLPRLDDDRRANLYDRANHFRRNNDFDKAMSIYEQILNEDGTDAEAYWSLVLCRYGIEYVEDPTSGKRIPTVNRAQFTSIFDDEDYRSAVAHADSFQREIFEAEAQAINEIQKGILAISQNEEPFDVFICYKETDAGGKRTIDSVLATELYYELTREENLKVFFARITLENKLGVAYEPYIFAALHSAKVMVVLGTRPEHFNAVWVKNEWSRYLSLIKQGEKKMLVPAYTDMDPYDLPQEFSHLQALDMSKLGFMQDLVHGIRKIVKTDEPKQTVAAANAPAGSANPLLERAFIFIEDGDFSSGNEYCEKVLDQDPRCAEAYLGKLMTDLKIKKRRQLVSAQYSFEENINYKRLVRFGSPELIQEINGYLEEIQERENKIAEDIRRKEEELKHKEAQRRSEQAKRYQADQERNATIRKEQEKERAAAMERQRQQHFENIAAQYRNIPSEKQIKKNITQDSSLRKLKFLGILLLFFYWPVGVGLLIYRNVKIKRQLAAENARYDHIRREYQRLKASNPTMIYPTMPKK